MNFSLISVMAISLLMAGFQNDSFGAETGKTERVKDVEKKYWGDKTEEKVYQERVYKKENHVEISAFGGMVSSDPFLTIKNVGGSIGFHFAESLSLHALGWKYFSDSSSALKRLENSSASATALTNAPAVFYGGEARLSLIYGKLSFFGASILQYDLYFAGGAGLADTKNGTFLTEMVGLGQQNYLNKHLSLKLDYRLTHYYEKIVDYRSNFSDVFMLGVGFLL